MCLGTHTVCVPCQLPKGVSAPDPCPLTRPITAKLSTITHYVRSPQPAICALLFFEYTGCSKMRRSVSIALVLVFCWLTFVPLLDSTDAGRHGSVHCKQCGPNCICCKRHSSNSSAPGFATVSKRCSCPAGTATVIHLSRFALELRRRFQGALPSIVVVLGLEALWHCSTGWGAALLRGPPVSLG